MKTRDEVLQEYGDELNALRFGAKRGRDIERLLALGWVLCYTEEEVIHDYIHGI